MKIKAPGSKSTDQRGFTLLELVIYIAVVGLVLVSATMFSFEFAASQAKSAALEEVNRNARFAVSRIAAEIREAADLNAGSSVFGSNPGTLSLATATGATDPTVFTVTGGTLNIRQGAGPVLPLTSSKVDVTEFTLENLSTAGKTKAVRVRLKVKTRDAAGLQEVAAETVVETTAKLHKNDGFSN